MANELVREKTKQKFLDILSEEAGGNISEACKAVGFSRQAINEWRLNDHSFDNRVQQAILNGKEDLADLAETHLQKRIRNGDTTAIIFTLKSLRRTFFGERIEVETAKKSNNGRAISLTPGFSKTLLAIGLKQAPTNVLTEEQRKQLNGLVGIFEDYYDNLNEDDKS
ncbi:hypothetical protein M1563_00875 [Patescibacteria group bacterium]|nr:hypothetical protein [Patescibacteria group bacterium]